MNRLIHYFLFLSLVSVLAMVFVIDTSLWREAVTGKYFWFAASVCVAVVFWAVTFLIKQANAIQLRHTDIWILLFGIYAVVNYYLLNNLPDKRWWLFVLILPLYVVVRTVSENERIKRWLLHAILLVVLVEAVWGLLQLYGITRSYHNMFKITGSLFNPGPYSCILAVGIPLALSYSIDNQTLVWERWAGRVTLALSLLALPATMGRASWITAIAGSILVLWQKLHLEDVFRKILSKKWQQTAAIGGLCTCS